MMRQKEGRVPTATADPVPAPTRDALGRVVRRLREARSLSQEGLADCVGDNMNQGDISRLELGRVKFPNERRLVGLARCLGTTPGALLAEAGYPGLADRPAATCTEVLTGEQGELIALVPAMPPDLVTSVLTVVRHALPREARRVRAAGQAHVTTPKQQRALDLAMTRFEAADPASE
jgi:transcriptional regulator with XRE-family HTH domain